MEFPSLVKDIKFNAQGLIPAIIQDDETNEVLMHAYMNQDAFIETLKSGKAHFWSRSRNKLWCKGESSGHVQIVRNIFIDCDNDTLLIKVKQVSAACHTGYYSCFYRKIDTKTGSLEVTGKKVFNPEDVYSKKDN